MGQEKTLIRAVIDTNVFVSAVLFKGRTSVLVDCWRTGKFEFLLSKGILEEYVHVLSHTKFKLTESEIHFILNEILLPFVTIVRSKEMRAPELRDPKDLPFLACALGANADYLVTGDRDLLEYHDREQHRVKIISTGDFLAKF